MKTSPLLIGEKGMYAEAIANYEKSLAINPNKS